MSLRSSAKVLPEDARAHHRAMVLQRLFHDGPTSRADLARATHLSRVSVSALVSGLLEDGLVAEAGHPPKGKVGKPATLVALRSRDHHVIAVDLTDDLELHGAILNLEGEIVARRSVPWAKRSGEDAVELIGDLCTTLAASATCPVLGIGVASPGVVDASGVVREVPELGWQDVPLAALLHERLGQPVHIANEADATAMGELTFGGASGDGVLVVTVGQGVGAGIVLDGRPVRGTRFAVGEIGHVTVVDALDLADVPGAFGIPQQCTCGRTGCLQTVLSVPALRRHADDPAALAAVGRRLGTVLAPVVSVLNLSEVVLSGPPELLDGPLRLATRATIRERTLPVVGDDLSLRMASLGESAGLRGAAVLVLAGQLGVT